MRIDLVRGDITEEAVDAIVTAANKSLRGGGGVDGAIHAAAGPELAEAGARLAPCAPGDAKATPSFALSPRVGWIIHTVGPVWDGGSHGEAEILARCYEKILEVAGELGVRTLSVPAISTGIYGYPKDEAADIAVRTLLKTPSTVEVVRLVAFDQENHEALARHIGSSVPGDVPLDLSNLGDTSSTDDQLS